MPQISVIVPVYKVEAFLDRCVTGILEQTFSDFELILVDDGSPDRCGAMCDGYAQKDSRVIVIHQKNGGLSAARNAGIEWAFAHSNSQWLSFIDSDDWVHPEFLERLLNAAVEQEAAVSVCGYAATSGEEPVIPAEQFTPIKWNTEAFYVEHTVNATVAWGKLYRKECFQTLRYPAGKIREDEFTTYQIIFRFPEIAVIQAPMYCYYVNEQGIMGSGQSRFREDIYEALEQQIQYFHEHGFSDACRCQVRMYMQIVHDKIQQLSGQPEHEAFLKKMNRRRRQHFSAYARLLKPDEMNSDGWVMTKMFPKRMKVYWFCRGVLRKLNIIKR